MSASKGLFDQLKLLYDQGLYSNVVEFGGLLTTIGEHSMDALTPCQAYQAKVFQADALLQMKEFRRAETLYKQALSARKHYLKTRLIKSPDGSESGDLTCEVEVKYSLHKCYMAIGQHNQALSILQSVIAKQRTPKINEALGRLYHQQGMERPAIAAYREVVRECPYALESIKPLMQLGVKTKEIHELVLDATNGSQKQLDWFPGYLAAQAALANKDYGQAVKEFKNLDERTCLRGAVTLLVEQGRAHYWAGEMDYAERVLHRAASSQPQLLAGMDCLAALLAAQGKIRELEALATRLMGVSEEAPESWVAMGYFSHLTKKSPRAVYFAHKACLLDTRNVEALLLKGSILQDLKKLPDAKNHYTEALQIASYRYEAHKGVIDCYLGLGRQREAVTVATAACKQLNNSPRALTLYATVLMKEPLSVARAKNLLEKASTGPGGHLPAVYMLADLLDREGNAERAVEILRIQLQHHSTCQLHQMLADLLAKNNEEEKAMEHYSIALSLDPKNEVALHGLQKMEQSTDGMDAQYDLEMEEVGSGSVGRGSPPQQELEDSETEAVWSDGDLNLVGSSN